MQLALSDDALSARLVALRDGPLRLAIVSNAADDDAPAAARALERWLDRVEPPRACPAREASPRAPRAGAYTRAARAGEPASALLLFPLGADAASASADALALALGAPGGPLHGALVGTGLASAARARVLGGARAPTLAIHVTAADGALGPAVMQTRAAIERVRQGALTDADVARARDAGRARERELLADPGERAARLWRGEALAAEPSIADVRALAARALAETDLVVVTTGAPVADAAKAAPSHP
ncbi:MAG: hypothetical protein R3B36_19405 [Polyangiaceae bacterium]